jgi:hypothetical protein
VLRQKENGFETREMFEIPFPFSAPPFAGLRRHARELYNERGRTVTRSTHASHCSAVLFGLYGLKKVFQACFCASPLAGCKGVFEN